MKKQFAKAILVCVSSLVSSVVALADSASDPVSAARGVIARFAGEKVASELKLEIIPADEGRPVYEVADNGRTLRGSSPVALAKAFYANCRDKHAGIRTWTGKRFDAAAAFAPSVPTRVVSPYRYSQYFNVVTYGYSLAYWDEARWMEELDWMALHGVNMALSTIAAEEIAARVWKRYGLTDAEIDEFFCGPAFLPWFRMGNLSERPDKLPMAWRTRSVRLQHAVLDRMRALGIEPIAPGFAGFLPKAFSRVRPDAQLRRMGWLGTGYGNNFLSPDQPIFREIAKAYVEEWEKEFGKCTFYLADSFNEMQLPWKGEAEILQGLADCGRNISGGIRDANPDAVWALQGWVFVVDAGTWTPERFAAMQSGVAPDAMLTIDLAVDYMHYTAKKWYDPVSPMNWNKYPKFGGQPWIWSAIPNMGGDSIMCGVLDFYANGHLAGLASPNRGKLIGHGMAPEGIENNEMLFELLAEGAWRTDYLTVRTWLREYSLSRYGKCPDKLMEYWDELLAGPYSTFQDHPTPLWQKVCSDNPFCTRVTDGFFTRRCDIVASWTRAIAALDACKAELGGSELYRHDRAEAFSMWGAYAADAALAKNDRDAVRRILREMDAALKGHPYADVRHWIAKARAAAEGDEKLADYYESDARRLITVWGKCLGDYSARIWSGLIGTYYLGRLETYWRELDAGRDPADAVKKFNEAFVEGRLSIK